MTTGGDSGDARDAEARQHEYFDGEQQQSDDEQQQLPVLRYSFEIERREIEHRPEHGGHQRKTDAGRLRSK